MHDQEKTESKKIILYDGKCPMCTVLADGIGTSPESGKFDLRDMTKRDLPLCLLKSDVEKEIHVIDEDGTIHKGAKGILAILEGYPRLRFLAVVGKLPGIRKLLPPMYHFVAKRRHTWFGPNARKFWFKRMLISVIFLAIIITLIKSQKVNHWFYQ